MLTYAAYNGQREYTHTLADGTVTHGIHQDDNSVVGLLTHITDGQKISDFLVVNKLDPAAVQRAFDAVGKTSNVLDLVAVYPQVKAWYYKYVQENPVPKPVAPSGPFLIPQTVEPDLPYHSIAMADGEKWAPDDKGWGLFWRDHDKWQRLFP